MAAARRAFAGLKPENVSGWRLFDAKDQVLGRLASRLSVVLQGKDKPIYSPSVDKGDVCIVVNADKIAVTGDKMRQKTYRWHTGYIGGLKERTLKDQMAKDPKEVLRKAVLRMLPRNRLADPRMTKLRIFEGEGHPFGEMPVREETMPLRKVREMRPRERRAADKTARAAASKGQNSAVLEAEA
ncbi:hypothetical protein CLOM_g18725 [Closterium sp. NIES-68]|nr:hypothetical protein CLOM_g18725 [Closterium sp. NIES-68]GJP74746.1 hypothetical protein CLOP_g5287 [Closterium sp. NIES-67]